MEKSKNIHFVIPLEAMTKKNHSRIVSIHNRPILLPSKQYLEFESKCKPYLVDYALEINEPINLQVIFYRGNKRRVDLPNLLNAICDILVKFKVVADDNCKIINSFEGSCVYYDKEHPRIEITITDGKKCWE